MQTSSGFCGGRLHVAESQIRPLEATYWRTPPTCFGFHQDFRRPEEPELVTDCVLIHCGSCPAFS